MTVSYTALVATCRKHGCFWRLLFRWRGSIYKLLLPNFIIYCILYSSLSGLYRFILNEDQRVMFENLSLMCQSYSSYIPVSFILGFYVNVVVNRWWTQYLTIPWPDSLALFVSTLIQGHQDDRSRLMRRTIMRYANLSLLMVLRMMSPAVKKRFATDDHLVEAGFLQPGEKKIIEELEKKTKHPKYWIPLVWAAGIITRARKEGLVRDDFAVKTLIDEVNKFRGGCGGLLNYDWISVPLVYTQVPPICFQVATLVVFAFFMGSLMADQYLDPAKGYPNHQGDLYIPIFSLLQFFFYMGWLMVAEVLVNPFGEDDDDFEVNWLIDRNLQISYVIVDEMHQEHPELLKDQYWDEIFPQNLPYTAATRQFQTAPHMGSTQDVQVPIADFVPFNTIMADDIEEEKKDDIDSEQEQTEHVETQPVSIIKRLGSFNLSPSNIPSISIFNPFRRNFMEHNQIEHKSSERTRKDEYQSDTSPVPSICKDLRDEDVFRMSDLCLIESGVTVLPNSRRGSLQSVNHDLTLSRKEIKHNASFSSFDNRIYDSYTLDFRKVKMPFKEADNKDLIETHNTCSSEISSSLKEQNEISSDKEKVTPTLLTKDEETVEVVRSTIQIEIINENLQNDRLPLNTSLPPIPNVQIDNRYPEIPNKTLDSNLINQHSKKTDCEIPDLEPIFEILENVINIT